MKFKKVLILALLLGEVVQMTAKTKIGNFYYEFSGNEAWICSADNAPLAPGAGNWYKEAECNIPESVEYQGSKFNVTRILAGAFYDCSKIDCVTIPNTVTNIEKCAFARCSNLKEIHLSSSLRYIGEEAFGACSSLQAIIFPLSLSEFWYDSEEYNNLHGQVAPFYGCDILSTVIYTSESAPLHWTATTNTFVTDKQAYSSPTYTMNQAKVIELITFNDTSFVYTGKSPTTTWTNNLDGYNVSLTMPILKKNAGNYKEIIPATFTRDGESFTANVVYRYTIKPANLKVKAESTSRLYGDDNPSFKISYTGFLNGEDESAISTKPIATTTAIRTSNVGDYPITVNGGIAKNYQFEYEPGILTVTKAPLTAKVNDTTKVYGTQNPAFTIKYVGLKNNEKEPQWSSPLQISTTATRSSDVGNYDVNATGEPTNYNLSSITKGILAIEQAPLTIRAKDTTRVYYSPEPAFEYACKGFVNNDDESVITTQPSFTTDATLSSNVGTYSITPSGAVSKNYSITYESGVLTINKRALKATSNCSREYGDDNPEFTISYDGFVNNENDNVISEKPIATTSATKTSNVGEYPIIVSGGKAINYDIVCQQGILSITKAPLSAKVNDATKIYGSKNPKFSLTYSGLKNGETAPQWKTDLQFFTDAVDSSGVGEYPIMATGSPINYELSSIAQGILRITQASLVIKANDASRMYFEPDPTYNYTCVGFVNNDNENVITKQPSFSTDATRTSNVGVYSIIPSGAVSKNYSITYEPGVLTINKRALKATSNCSREYGDDNPEFTISYDGFVNNENENVISKKPTATTIANKLSNVGDYTITVSGGSATNYDIVCQNGVLTITKAPLLATVKDTTKTYGSQNPTFSLKYEGLKNNQITPNWLTRPTFQTLATQSSDIGQYDVTATNGTTRNYDVTFGKGVLTITKAQIKIIADDKSRFYYEDNPEFTFKYSGFLNGDNASVITKMPELSTTASLQSKAGKYPINATGAEADNYSFVYESGTLEIKRRTLNVSTGNYKRAYNEDNPEFLVIYNGFVNNENEDVLIAKPIISTSATRNSDVGVYTLWLSGGEADNYDFNYNNGQLEIEKAYQTLTWEQSLDDIPLYSQVELEAEASSGLPVTYNLNNDTVCNISYIGDKAFLDCFHYGKAVIVAQQDGDKNYWPTTKSYKELNVVDPTGIQNITYDTALNGKVSVEKGRIIVKGLDKSLVLRIYNLSGANVYSGGDCDIIVPVGVYIVKLGNSSTKLVVK